MNTLFLAVLHPLFQIGNSVLLSWLVTFAFIAFLVLFVIWLVTKLAGPPIIAEPFRPWVWLIVIVALLIFIFAALGIGIP